MGKNLKGREIGKGLSQRKVDGIYQGRITTNGTTRYVYDKSLSKCKIKLEELKTEMLREEKNLRPNVTLKAWFEEWWEKFKRPQLKNEVSASHYYRKINNTFINEIGAKKLKDICQLDIQLAANELINRYAPESVREALCVLREVFDIAVVNQVIPVSPCVSVKVKNANTKAERRVMTDTEEELFLSVAKNDYFYEVFTFLLLTGLRIGELSALQWDDINFEKKEISISKSMSISYENGKKTELITTPKTENSYRVVPFFDGVEEILKTWFDKQQICKKKLGSRWRCPAEYGDLVFTTTMGSPVTRYIIAPKINKIVKEINLREVTEAARENRVPTKFQSLHPHAFRHTFATRCMEKDLNPAFVQNIMGHANYQTTLSYTHVLDKVKDAEVKKAGNLLH